MICIQFDLHQIFFPLEELRTFVSAHALTTHEMATRHYKAVFSVSNFCYVCTSGMEDHSQNDPVRGDQDKVSGRAALNRNALTSWL